MSETGPRKRLWELMGQKQPAEAPVTSPEPAEPSASPPSAAGQSAAEEIAQAPSPEPESLVAQSPLNLQESTPDKSARSRGLWQLMQAAANAAPAPPQTPEADGPSSAAFDSTRAAFEGPVKGAHRRLRQLQAPPINDDTPEAITPSVRVPEMARTEQASVEDVPPISPSATPPDSLPPAISEESSRQALAGIQRSVSRRALWSALLGVCSVPISLIAILPELWTRFPPSAVGFAALILGITSQSEIQRSRGQRHGTVLAYLGMALGLWGMFAGPLVYAPLDVYGQWCDHRTHANLRQIGLATETYYQQRQSYPAGGITQEVKGTGPLALHGWMTLLLPYLPEGAALAPRIDLRQPYSAPVNQLPMSQLVPSFLAGGGSRELIDGKYGPAHFAGVGGIVRISEDAMAHAGVFDANSHVSRSDVLDGLSNTMQAGEIATRYPAWGDPHNWRQIGRGLNRDADGFGNARRSGALFLMADGSVRFFSQETDPRVLRALSTRDGEEQP